MKTNISKLYNFEEDDCLRKCLRIFIISKNNRRKVNKKATKQSKIVKIKLKKIKKKLKNRLGLNWKKEFIKKLPFEVKQNSVKDWFSGRSSPPIIAIQTLKKFGFKKEVKEIMLNVKYISSTTSDIIKIPNINSDLAYLTGVILGDGSLSKIVRKKQKNFEYRITITTDDKELIKLLIRIVNNLFEKKNFI